MGHRLLIPSVASSGSGRALLLDVMGRAAKNYYAVALGRNPGVYRTWVDCEKQVLA